MTQTPSGLKQPFRYARSMCAQTQARSKKAAGRSKKKKTTAGWLMWWPLVAGILITFAAVRTAEILPLMGPSGLLKLQLLYPYALLLEQPQLQLPEQTSDSWSQIMLYAQWALYGLYASLAMQWTTRSKALLQVAAVHLLGFVTLWVLTQK